MVRSGPCRRSGLTSFALKGKGCRRVGGCGPGECVADSRGGGSGVKCALHSVWLGVWLNSLRREDFLGPDLDAPRVWYRADTLNSSSPAVSQLRVLPPAWLSDSVIPVTKRWCNPPLVERREKLTNRTPLNSSPPTMWVHTRGLNWLDLQMYLRRQ